MNHRYNSMMENIDTRRGSGHYFNVRTTLSVIGVLLGLVAAVGICVGIPSEVLADATTTCATTTNLITNGDFESPVVTHADKWDVFPSGTGGLNWSVEWVSNAVTTYNGHNRPDPAPLEIQRTGHLGYLPAQGDQWAELDSDWLGPNVNPSIDAPASIKIYQDIPTVPGNDYKLTFSFSPRPDAPDASQNVLKVSWDNNDVDTISRASTNPAQTEWQNYEYTVHATGATTRVAFSDAGIPNSVGTYLDNVSLTCKNAVAAAGGGGGGGGGAGTTTATTTPSGGSGTGGGTVTGPTVAPLTAYSSYGGGTGGGGSTGGSTGGGVSTPTGEVLGATTGYPGMPSTGGGGNIWFTYILSFITLFTTGELIAKHYRVKSSIKKIDMLK